MEKLRWSPCASRGIGRAIAIELAREGAKVAINYSSSAKAKEVAEEITNLGELPFSTRRTSAVPRKPGRWSSMSPRSSVAWTSLNNAGTPRLFAFQNDRLEEHLALPRSCEPCRNRCSTADWENAPAACMRYSF